MTDKIIQHFLGRAANDRFNDKGIEIPCGWYVNGKLVAQGVNYEQFMRDYVQNRYGEDHWDGEKVLPDLEAVEENAIVKRKASIKDRIERLETELLDQRVELDKLSFP